MNELVGLQLFWSGTPTFSSGTPTFCQMGVLNSCFQNPSESSEDHNAVTPVRLEPAASRFRDKHSTTEPLRFNKKIFFSLHQQTTFSYAFVFVVVVALGVREILMK